MADANNASPSSAAAAPANGPGAGSGDPAALDEADYDKCRIDYVDEIAYLEAEFARLKSHLFDDRLAFILAKEQEVLEGRAPEYLEPLAQLTENCRIRVQVAKLTKQLRVRSARHCLDCELQWSKSQLAWDSQLLAQRLRDNICQQIGAHLSGRASAAAATTAQQLPLPAEANERHAAAAASAAAAADASDQRQSSLPQSQTPEPPPPPRPVSVAGPVVIYQLSEADILADCAALCSTLTGSGHYSVVHGY